MNGSFLIVIFIFLINCSKREVTEERELNKIINSVLKFESQLKKFDKNKVYLVNGKLQKLKIYVPTKKQILGEEPPPPPYFSKNIIYLLDLNEKDSKNRTQDSLNLLKQNNYIFDSLKVHQNLNPNIKIANKKEIYNRIELYQFSNPVYFNDKFAYIETNYFDTVFGIGFGYLLEKQRDETWKVKEKINTFIT